MRQAWNGAAVISDLSVLCAPAAHVDESIF